MPVAIKMGVSDLKPLILKPIDLKPFIFSRGYLSPSSRFVTVFRSKFIDMPKKSKKPEVFDKPQRLQRVLAASGCGSRRECETYIQEGRVLVDGRVVTELGTKVDPAKSKIFFDGQRISEPRLQYFMLNKPPGVVSTASDPAGRLRVVDLIKSNLRVYNVGRLDKSSEGLILVTNDGDLANRLTHPRYGVEKKYHVLVAGRPTREDLDLIKKGVYLAEAFVKVANVTVRKRLRDGTWLEIILDEGRNREIRRLLARVGHKVVRLVRVAIGPLRLEDLPVGAHRKLTFAEIDKLRRSTQRGNRRSGGRSSGGPPRGSSQRKSVESKPPRGKSSKGSKKTSLASKSGTSKRSKSSKRKRSQKPVAAGGRSVARAKPVKKKRKKKFSKPKNRR